VAVPTAVIRAYSLSETALLALARYVRATLAPWCDDRRYSLHLRVKAVGSVSEKLESGRFRRWSDVDDLLACSIVVPTAAHEEGVRAFLDRVFVRVGVKDRNSSPKPPEVFRFDSTRYTATVSESGARGLPPGAETLRFEVQILTVFEHAWAVVTHDLVYKADDVDWRRLRLGAYLKATVEQIDNMITGFETGIEFVPPARDPAIDARQKIVSVFKSLRVDGIITAELQPESWRRFADNVFSLVASYSSRSETPGRVLELCNAVDDHLRGTSFASGLHSGSLFQVVVGLIVGGIVPSASVRKFTFVESSELRDLYGVATVPRAFIFDGVGEL
jgi:hypothetical protein